LFLAAAAVGTILDAGARAERPASSTILAADLHIHPYPGDGSLPVWELRHEADRRQLDVIAITAHNNTFGLRLGQLRPARLDGPIVIAGQEVTTQKFHMVALGISEMIDWRLSARDAIAAIHAQGGVAIASHPSPRSWRDDDVEALKELDGAEVAHQSVRPFSVSREQFQAFFDRVQSVNPGVAAIGSSDFHMTAPLGVCRTYLLVHERSAAGVLNAIREGRTVARDARGLLYGPAEYVAEVERHLNSGEGALGGVSGAEKLAAFVALLALAVLVVG
jgi:predicted metal-dependent phosphoesterase TrpH